MLEALVTAEFRTLLLMSDAEFLPLDESYFALGITSLGAVEIQQRLEAVLGRRIDSSSLFNNPTVGHLLGHLRSVVLGDLFVAQLADPAQRDPSPVRTAPSTQSSSARDLLDDLLGEA